MPGHGDVDGVSSPEMVLASWEKYDWPGLTVHEQDLHVLHTVEAYNRYCYVVAGNVGHLLTRMTAEFYGFSQHTVNQLLQYTEHFARTLQKTKYLKGFWEGPFAGHLL